MIIKTILVLALSTWNISHAQQCDRARGAADQACDKSKIAPINQRTAETSAAINGSSPGLIANQAMTNTQSSQQQMGHFQKTCDQAIKECSKICETEAAGLPAKKAAALANKKHCETGPPAQAKAGSDAGMAAIAQLLAAIIALMIALGMMKDDKEQKPCVNYPPGAPIHPEYPACVATAAVEDTPVNPSPTQFTNGDFRHGDEGKFIDSGLAGGEVDPGKPAQQSLASFGAGAGVGGGSGANAAAPQTGGNRGGSGPESDGAPQIKLASTGGGGSSGGGGSGSSGGYRGNGSGTGSSKTLLEENQLQVNVDKNLQARGLAAEGGGPAGGITSAHSLDNFQKVENRIQVERNTLHELNTVKPKPGFN